jgi:hypothetical protein
MAAPANVLLIGSIGLNDTEEVFRALASTLGDRAKRYPDGETGARHYWIRWQQTVFADNPDLVPAEVTAGYREGTPLKYYRLRNGRRTSDLTITKLGYADAAIDSYKTFARLKRDNVIPQAVRFQVSLPTPVAVITSFIVPEERAQVEPVYEMAMANEVARILAAIAHRELALQWDVCLEILAADGAFPLHYDDAIGGTTARLARLSKPIPEDVELGIHLCYGDPGHKHIKEPADLGTAVRFSNGIASTIGRRLDWVHMPVPRGRTDDDYFSALADLRLPPETELALGLVHYSDGAAGAAQRIETAKKFTERFGIATECGFGRRDPATIPDLLHLHAQVADATPG